MTLSDSRNKARALGRIKRLASSGLPLEPFVRGVFESLNDGVPHSPNRVMLASGGERIDAYVGSTEEIARATPLFRKFFVDSTPEMCGVKFPYGADALRNVLPSQTIWTQQDLLLDHFFRGEAYNVVYRPLGWHHLLQVVFQESGEFFGYCPIWRSSDQQPFSRDDIEFLRTAAPHVAHGLRAARLLERSESWPQQSYEFQPLSAWRSGIILLDSTGKLIAIDPDARLILQQLGVLDGVTIDQFTPAPVRDGLAYISHVIAKIFHCADSDAERAGAPVYRLYQHWTGIVLKLRGVRMMATDGREYTAILVERGETVGARHLRMSARWGLSQREAEILSLIADGKTGPEIAVLLAISHDTVRKHTSKILDKLGVETRIAAVTLALDQHAGSM
jgi:DNA-binding CsgD family transcriptional regulator